MQTANCVSNAKWPLTYNPPRLALTDLLLLKVVEGMLPELVVLVYVLVLLILAVLLRLEEESLRRCLGESTDMAR